MANAIDAGIRLTPPYGKSRHAGQCAGAHAAMRIAMPIEGVRVRTAPDRRAERTAKKRDGQYGALRNITVALEHWIIRFRFSRMMTRRSQPPL
jgi:hypothetical protein